MLSIFSTKLVYVHIMLQRQRKGNLSLLRNINMEKGFRVLKNNDYREFEYAR